MPDVGRSCPSVGVPGDVYTALGASQTNAREQASSWLAARLSGPPEPWVGAGGWPACISAVAHVPGPLANEMAEPQTAEPAQPWRAGPVER